MALKIKWGEWTFREFAICAASNIKWKERQGEWKKHDKLWKEINKIVIRIRVRFDLYISSDILIDYASHSFRAWEEKRFFCFLFISLLFMVCVSMATNIILIEEKYAKSFSSQNFFIFSFLGSICTLSSDLLISGWVPYNQMNSFSCCSMFNVIHLMAQMIGKYCYVVIFIFRTIISSLRIFSF